MATQKQYFEWMKHKHWIHQIGDLTMLPIMIVLWYLGYNNGFWIILILYILNEIAYVSSMNKIKRLAGMEEW